MSNRIIKSEFYLPKNYIWKPQSKGGKLPKKGDIIIGFELEVEKTDGSLEHRYEIAKEVHKYLKESNLKDLYYCICNDGSLGSGFEIKFHPCILKRYYELSKDIREFFAFLRKNGLTASKYWCGLHFHISRIYKINDQNYISRSLNYNNQRILDGLLGEYKNLFVRLARRNSFCGRIQKKSLDEYGDIEADWGGDRAQAVCDYYIESMSSEDYNWDCGQHMEFRMWKGALNFDTFMARLELTYLLFKECVKEIKWEDVLKKYNKKVTDNYMYRKLIKLSKKHKLNYALDYIRSSFS
jgi:hypothetical protein